jgi:hypothetical protein
LSHQTWVEDFHLQAVKHARHTPQGTWKTAKSAVFHSAHSDHLFGRRRKETKNEQPKQLNQTVHKRHWSKLPLGNRLVTDFVLQEANGDYLLVELERADHQLFRADGQQAEPVTHAINQVIDWFRYVQDNRDMLVREHDLEGLSTAPRGLVVMGRSNSLSDENKHKLKVIAEMHPRLAVVTYDELLENARTAFMNLFGQAHQGSQQTRQVVHRVTK